MIYKEKEFYTKNNKKLIVKTPEITDAKDLVETMIMITKEATECLNASPETFLPLRDDISKEEDFIKNCREGLNCYVCVYDNNKIIGDCELKFSDQIKIKHRCSIGLAIAKEYQNIGIGSFLFDEMINIAKSTPGVEQIELEVISTNERAKHLYKKKGFVKVGDIPHNLKLSDGTYLDGESMVLFLKK